VFFAVFKFCEEVTLAEMTVRTWTKSCASIVNVADIGESILLVEDVPELIRSLLGFEQHL